MKMLRRIAGSVAVLSLVLSLAGPIDVSAATTPSLGMASTFAILASTYTNTAIGTTITGDVGYTVAGAPAVAPTVNGTVHAEDATFTQAGLDQGTALGLLNAQSCTSIGAAVNLNAISIAGGAPGTFTPGCYSSTGAMNIVAGTTVTLNGAGTYIFRPDGALTTGANSIVTLTNGASSCDVFWTPTAATTLGANSTFIGTNIDAAGITIGSTVNWSGRALAFGGTVSTVTDTINATCVTTSATPPVSPADNTITVIKQVINDNGGTATYTDFPLFINGNPVTSGQSIRFAAGTYTVSETSPAGYARTFAGDCNASGQIFHGGLNTRNDVCFVINNDIGPPAVIPLVPPLIDVLKVPSPLALPGGPGPVTYTYTLRNIGTVPVTNVTMVGDTCSPIVRISGDTNGNNVLEVSETWVHTCTTTLTETHTNTVVATGQANGITATDVASATVVVGAPIVPPLIHVVKVPSPLTLSAGGGMVTFTKTVTNPGTVALSDVSLTDDMCAPVSFISGDTDGDTQLDPSETWIYTCSTNLTETTTNTVGASGSANGFTAIDYAIAPVVVAAAVPTLPVTGVSAAESFRTLAIAAASLCAVAYLFSASRKKQVKQAK